MERWREDVRDHAGISFSQVNISKFRFCSEKEGAGKGANNKFSFYTCNSLVFNLKYCFKLM